MIRLSLSVLVALALATFAPRAGAQQFPAGPGNANCPDDFGTGAVFKIVALDGTTMEVVVPLQDPNTIVGRSDPFNESDAMDLGAAICSAGVFPYADTLALVPDSCRQPAGWLELPDERREVHTQILSLDLTDGATHVRAGQDYWNQVVGTPMQAFFDYSTGEVASLYDGVPADTGQDFPARSFFNVFVEVEFAGNRLYNKTPMVLLAEIGAFPPDLNLPSSTYIHDPSFGAVALFDQLGLPWGFMSSAGHGGPTSASSAEVAERFLNFPVTFSVDAATLGLDPALTLLAPNEVFLDGGLPVQQLTAFLAMGGLAGSPPEARNVRSIVGGLAGPAPPAFAASVPAAANVSRRVFC